MISANLRLPLYGLFVRTVLVLALHVTEFKVLLFFGHRSLTKNKTQTAVMNMTDERIVRKN